MAFLAAHVIVKIVLCLSLVLFTQLAPGLSYTLDQGIQLMTDNLDEYDRRFRPKIDQSEPIVVNITFDLIGLQEFDEVKEKFSVMGLLHLTWYDEKLAWKPSSYGYIYTQVYSTEDIWYPILVLSNPTKELKDIVQDWMSIRVIYTGLALFYPGSIFEASCSIDVTYYPFDIQTCQLNFVPWAIGVDEMILHTPSSTVLQSYFSENGEWTFIDLNARDGLASGSNMVTFTFKMKRKPAFLLVNIILPIIFMAVISVFVFVLPPESGERISFSVTVLLALAVFFTMVSDNLPKTSKPLSHLSYFLTIILVCSVTMSIVAICNLRLYFKDDKSKVPIWLAFIVNILRCKICKMAKSTGRVSTPKRNQVNVVIVKEAKKKPDVVETEFMPSKTMEVTWKDVSSTIDIICIVIFSLAIIVTCSVYMYILTSNSS